jgi:pyrroloquinoline quinone biosynthesis protein D
MDGEGRPRRPQITAQSIPRLPRHVKLRHDKTRDRWVILVPERVLLPDDTAVAVLQRVDGARRVCDIVDELAQLYLADAALILTDSIALLQDLADKSYLQTVTEPPDA